MGFKRMENGVFIGKDYFEKLLEGILLNERQFYLLRKRNYGKQEKRDYNTQLSRRVSNICDIYG